MIPKRPRRSDSLYVTYGGCSNSGLKVDNEAFMACMPADLSVAELKGFVACIADGNRNSRNAKIASQIACAGFVNDYYATPDFWTVKKSASAVIESINSWLHHQDRNSLESQGLARDDAHVTTFSAMIVKSRRAHFFHLGDSRIYHMQRGRLEQLTHDHSYYLSDSSRPQIVRALGLESTVDIEYFSIPVREGDRFLLSTDGVHGNVSHQQLESLCSIADANPETTAAATVRAAIDKSGEDNASALLVEIVALPEEGVRDILLQETNLAIPPLLTSGKSIDNFTIVEALAIGSRSCVYLARNNLDGKRYVLKMPSKNVKEDIGFMEDFVREQWIGQRLDHANLMKIHERPDSSQFLYHVFEYVEGITLKQWLENRPCLSLAEAGGLLKKMIRPVRYLHRNNLVHRDLKPENFIINHDGELKLIDFGTVRVDSIDELANFNRERPVGDIGYIAPELLVNGRTTERSDLYSLACIVYEMLTRELPYAAILSNQDYPRQFDLWVYRPTVASRHLKIEPPPWVDRVLKKALAPDPRFRYSTLSEFETDLLMPGSHLMQSAESGSLIERNPLLFWKGIVIVLFIALLVQSVYLSVVLW